MNEEIREPWRHVGNGDIVDAEGTDVASAYLVMGHDNEVLASRIVACVNACATLSTGVLEKHIGKGVFEILTEITAQRDRLLAMAKQAGKELAAVAAELKHCSTIEGDWREEWEAKEDYDRLMALSARLEKGEASV